MLAFLAVGLLGTVLVATVINRRAQLEFSHFVTRRYEQDLVRQLTFFYQTNSSWDNIERLVERFPRIRSNGGGKKRFSGLLADASGVILIGSDRYGPGESLSPSQLRRATPVVVDNEVVGHLLLIPPEDLLQGQAERFFLDRFASAVTWGALGGTTLALLLGVLLARTLTQPLQELTTATESIAAGDLGRQVSVRSNDEIGKLAASFNTMSLRLKEANQLRKQMTADIAHDLRTPLSVILGYTEALHDGKLQGSSEMYEVLHRQARHLSHLVDDLRTLSLADAGELSLQKRTVSPVSLIEQALKAHRGRAEEEQIQLSVDINRPLPKVYVDPERIMQVLGNLISNALRHTKPEGEIRIQAKGENGHLQLSVVDTGGGIAAEDLPHVFERFYRADKTRAQEGESGLGLPIAKSIIEAHGGTISAQSQLGQGAVFTISLPTVLPSATPGSD